MPQYRAALGTQSHVFDGLKTLLARASPDRSGDHLAGVAAASAEERVAARRALADLPLRQFLHEAVVPYEDDEVTRLILDTHDAAAFAPVAHLTVGGFREWLLSDAADGAALAALAPGLTPEMVAAVSKLMRNQDLIQVARKVRVQTRFRNTLGLPGRMATRLQPNHPTDDAAGIAASLLDGLLHGSGDAVIGINPVTDNVAQVVRLLRMLDAVIARWAIPTQSCVLTHVTNTLQAIERGAPVDLVFQSIGGTEATNAGFGIDLAMLGEAQAAARSLRRGARFADADGTERLGEHVMYFETGQGSALSAGAHHGCDQQTVEARAYAVARRFEPLLVNTVVGFIGPEYLYDGKQIVRAGLEDHFCGKLLGLPMGCDICYTNHAEADQDDMDVLLTVLGVAGCSFVMGVPGSDDVMLNYQSTSFHDALYARRVLGLRPAPEFEAWLERMQVMAPGAPGQLLRHAAGVPPAFAGALAAPGVREVDAGSSRLGAPPIAAAAPARSPADPAYGPAPSAAHDTATPSVIAQPWQGLRRYTPARIGLGRAGTALPTAPQLEFQQAHALARDAVHRALDVAALCGELEALGLPVLPLHSAAGSRTVYLQRPDLGRRLDEASAARLDAVRSDGAPRADLALVVADGLSSLAVQRHAAPLVAELLARLGADDGDANPDAEARPTPANRWTVAPLTVVEQGRVAIGDEVAERLGAACVAVLIGERPGLSSPDSLGIYLTWAPRVGRRDAERNCISNVRPEGLPVPEAAARLAYLLREARRRGLSGVALKDDSAPDERPAVVDGPNILLGG
jgi:ethanolamine ammonia-lyase large subunit